MIPRFIRQFYLKTTACQEALNKHLFSAAVDYWIVQLLLDAIF